MITLTSTTATDVLYNQFRVVGDAATFLGTDATDASRDQLAIRSTSPKAGNNFLGNRRSTISKVKSTNVVNQTGEPVVRDRKISVDFSMPVGVTEESLIEDAYQLGSLLQNADFIKKFALVGQIEH